MLSAGRVRAQNEAEIGLPAYRYCEDRDENFNFFCRDRASVVGLPTPVARCRSRRRQARESGRV